jgi:hypothetical protein
VGFAEEIGKLLKMPSESDDHFTDAGRLEAASRLKRAESTYAQDPRGPGAVAAIGFYREALDLYPLCKPAYEGIAKIILARAADDKKALECLSRWVAIGRRKLPDDTDIATLEKKVNEMLRGPPKVTDTQRRARPPSARTGSVKRPTRNCPACGSPIPADSTTCRSCELSSEVGPPAGVKQEGGRRGVVIVALAALAGVAAVVILALVKSRFHH